MVATQGETTDAGSFPLEFDRNSLCRAYRLGKEFPRPADNVVGLELRELEHPRIFSISYARGNAGAP